MAFMLNRRGVLAGIAATGLAAGGARADESFVVGTFGGPYEKLLRKDIIPDFDRKNHVATQLQFGLGVIFIQRVLASRGHPPYDVFVVNEDEALMGQGAGLFETLDPARLPNLTQVYDIMRPPTVPLYGTMCFQLGCVYNSKRMKPPASWTELWTKGVRVGVAHPQNSYGMLFLMLAAEMNGGGLHYLMPGFAQIRKLDHPKFYRGVVDGIELLRRGEIDASLFYRNRAAQLHDGGQPIGFTEPKEGTFGIRSGVQVPRHAHNLDAAYAWVNMAMSAGYQKVFADAYYSPSNSTLVLPPAEAAKHIYGSKAVHALRYADWATLNAQKSEVYERWDKEFAS